MKRSGNRPSAEGAAARFDQLRTLCRDAVFRRITFGGIPISARPRIWIAGRRTACASYLAIDAGPNLIALADALPPEAWTRLVRRPAYADRRDHASAGECDGRHHRGAASSISAWTRRPVAEFPYHPRRGAPVPHGSGKAPDENWLANVQRSVLSPVR